MSRRESTSVAIKKAEQRNSRTRSDRPLAAQFIAEVYPEVSPLVNIDSLFDNETLMSWADVIP